MSKKIIAFILFLLMPLLVFSGFSSWIIVGEKDALIGENPTTGPVCYINSNDKQYTSIEKALSVAGNGDKVYVIPTGTGTVAPEVKIRKDCTVKSGVTLYLPTDNTNYDKGFGGSVAEFADSTPDKVNTNRRNFVSIDTDVVMTIATGGTLVIGGTFGSESNGMTGGINGIYSEIMLYADAKIICNGSMECYGYIKEASNNNGSQLILDRATAKVPFTIYDFKGGTQTTNLNRKNICPFDEYDIACIQSEIVIHSNSILKGMVRLEAGGQQLNEVITVVGGQNVSSPTTSNTALILRSGYAKLKYDSTFVNGVCVTTIADRQTTIASLHNGTIEIGGFKLTIMYIYEVDTTKMFFPVSYRFSYEIDEGGILNIPLKVKFMPGSKLLVKKGGTVNVSNNVIFYPNTWKGKTINTDQPYPGIFESAKLINNGDLVINSGGKLGGLVETTQSGARITVKTDYVGDSSLVSSIDDNESVPVTQSFRGYISNSNTESLFNKTIYVSENNIWKELSFKVNYFIKYINGPLDGQVVKMTSHTNDVNPTYSKGLNLTTPAINSYKFVAWYYDSNCVNAVGSNYISGTTLEAKTINGQLNLYAQYEFGASVIINYYNAIDDSKPVFTDDVTPGKSFTFIDALDPIITTSSDGSYKTKYTFTSWSIVGQTGTFAPGATYNVDINTPDKTVINIKENCTVGTYYKLEISGKFSTVSLEDINEKISISSGKTLTSIDSGTVYYVLYQSSVTVGTYGNLGLFSVGASRTLTITGGITKTVVASGDRGFDDRIEGAHTFNMPSATVKITVT